MNEITARRFAGAAGIAAATALLIEVPLYFVYSAEPPDSNVLSRLLIGMFGMAFLLLFVTAFRELVKRVDPGQEWIGNLAHTVGLLYIGVTLVSSGLEAGAVIAADQPIDPTIAVSGTYILYGSIGRLLLAMFFTAVGYAVHRTGMLPRWTARSAFAMALINLAFVPSMFFGNTPANFYAANGWGSTASMGGLLCLWTLAFGIALVRSARRAPAPATPALATR